MALCPTFWTHWDCSCVPKPLGPTHMVLPGVNPCYSSHRLRLRLESLTVAVLPWDGKLHWVLPLMGVSCYSFSPQLFFELPSLLWHLLKSRWKPLCFPLLHSAYREDTKLMTSQSLWPMLSGGAGITACCTWSGCATWPQNLRRGVGEVQWHWGAVSPPLKSFCLLDPCTLGPVVGGLFLGPAPRTLNCLRSFFHCFGQELLTSVRWLTNFPIVLVCE